MQTGTLRRSVARASKGLMVAASVFCGDSRRTDAAHGKVHSWVSAPGPAIPPCALPTPTCCVAGEGSYEYPQVPTSWRRNWCVHLRSFWMGPSGVCSVMDNVADGTSRTGCSAVVYQRRPAPRLGPISDKTTVPRSSSAAWASPVLAGRKIAIGPINTCAIYGASATPGSAGQVACSGENWAVYRLAYPPLAAPVFGSGVIAGLINIVDISVSTDAASP